MLQLLLIYQIVQKSWHIYANMYPNNSDVHVKLHYNCPTNLQVSHLSGSDLKMKAKGLKETQ